MSLILLTLLMVDGMKGSGSSKSLFLDGLPFKNHYFLSNSLNESYVKYR